MFAVSVWLDVSSCLVFWPCLSASRCWCLQCPAACPAGPQGVAGLPGMKVKAFLMKVNQSIAQCQAQRSFQFFPSFFFGYCKQVHQLQSPALPMAWDYWGVCWLISLPFSSRDTKVVLAILEHLEQMEQKYEFDFDVFTQLKPEPIPVFWWATL